MQPESSVRSPPSHPEPGAWLQHRQQREVASRLCTLRGLGGELEPCLPPCLRPQTTSQRAKEGPGWCSGCQHPWHAALNTAHIPDHSPCSWPDITACQTFSLFQLMVHMDIKFFLSFSSTGLLLFFKEPGKGYIFLHKHHFISGQKTTPKSLSSKFFMVFLKKSVHHSIRERSVNDANLK